MVESVVETAARVEVGTEEAFEGFFRQHYSNLARALYLLTGERSEAEDLAQESFARVFERWDRVSLMGSSAGYLYRTALNLHRSRVRRLAVHARRLVGRDGPPDPADVVETRLDIIRAITSLPPGQREALVLVEWLDLDATEAGRILGIEAVSVRGRLHRAKATLREQLGGIDG